MTNGIYHCSVCGENFSDSIDIGTFNVTCPNGHVLPYTTTLDGSEYSSCDCPVCGTAFVFDLLDGPDVPILEFAFSGGPDMNLNVPFGGCVIGSNLLIVDSRNARLVSYNQDLTFWDKYKFSGNGTITSSAKRACFGDGKLYVTDGSYVKIYTVVLDENNKISSITYSARFGGVGSGDGKFTAVAAGICTDGSYLYVCDDTGHRIQKFDMSGTYVSKIGSLGSGNDEFNRPYGIAYYDGKLYVSEYVGLRVNIRLASDLSYVGKFGSSGAGNGQFSNNTFMSIAADSSGIYTMQTYRVQKFDVSTYAYVAQIGTLGAGDDQFTDATDIQCVDSKLLIFDNGNSRVKYHSMSDLSFDSKAGTYGGNDVSAMCSPIFGFSAVWSGASLEFEDGQIFPISSDTNIIRNGYVGTFFRTDGQHTGVLKGVPLSEVKRISSSTVNIANAWDLYQPTPVASHGAFAFVWYDGSLYHEYYPYDGYTKLGHATSVDGIAWEVDTANNPVMIAGPGSYDSSAIAVPNVWKEGGTWYMLYRGSGAVVDNVCLATSPDGVSWTKYGNNPVISAQPDPAGVMRVGSTYYLYCNTTSGNREINVYTSADLHTWTLQTPDPLFAGGRFCSSPFKFGDKYYLLVSKYIQDINATLSGGCLELFESNDPTFTDAILLGFVMSQPSVDHIIDTPCIISDTIYRDSFPNNRLMCYFSMGGPTYYLYLTIQSDIAAAIAAAIHPLTDGVVA